MRRLVLLLALASPLTAQNLDPDALAGMDGAPKGLKRLVKKGDFGCVLGRIGPNGKPFRIKADDEIRAPTSGQLFPLVDDTVPDDNTGGFTVDLEPAK